MALWKCGIVFRQTNRACSRINISAARSANRAIWGKSLEHQIGERSPCPLTAPVAKRNRRDWRLISFCPGKGRFTSGQSSWWNMKEISAGRRREVLLVRGGRIGEPHGLVALAEVCLVASEAY